VDERLTNLIVIGACGLVWLVALIAGIWRVRYSRDRRGLILAVLALLGLLLLIVVGTGTQYGSKAASALRERLNGPPATLVTEWTGPGELCARVGSRSVTVESDDGRYELPAGTVQLDTFTAHGPAGATTSEARTQLRGERMVLTAGQEHPLAVGPPYTARVESNARLRRLELKLRDARGRETTLSDTAGSSPPGFEVLDERGKVVWQGKFAYG
jgi:hypothetical protein